MRTRLLALAALVLAAGARDADAQRWRVVFDARELEGPLLWNVETDTVEKSWCLDAVPDGATKTLRVREVYSSDVTTETRAQTTFSCPAGTVPLHRHYAEYAHDRGPSADDYVKARRQKFVGVVMFVERDRAAYRYIVYGALPR